MGNITLETETLAAVQRLTDDPTEFVQQAVVEKLEREEPFGFSPEDVAALDSMVFGALFAAEEKCLGSS